MISEQTLYSYVGQKYSRLKILSIGIPKKRADGRHHNTVNCVCDCGTTGTYLLTALINGHTQSCGCLRVDNYRKKVTTHGLSYHPIFSVYEGMMQRCYYQKDPAFHNYGGRGVTVCDEWKNDKKLFFKWALDNGWAKGLELDRTKNNLGYAPTNCRFVTKKINQRNKRCNRIVFYKGERKALSEWCEILCLKYFIILRRLNRKWTVELAFEKPSPYTLSNAERRLCGIKEIFPPRRISKKQIGIEYPEPLLCHYDINNDITIVQ